MKVCLTIGDPISHSLSPQIHTAGYQALGIDGEYRYEARRVKPEGLTAFIREVRDKDIRGVSCTTPHKVALMQHLDEIDITARRIGAVNTIVNDNGVLTGYNTDWLGAVMPLERLTPLKGKKVALLGAGGAAKAIAYGLMEKGADLTVYNRTVAKAGRIAQEFGAKSASLEHPDAVRKADIVVNATSAGMDDPGITPLAKEYITATQIVFDSIYSPYETRLLREAIQQGAQIIHGTEMLLQQAVAQFKLYTGYDAPEDAMRAALSAAIEARGEK